jgi:Phosphotransferase enzyme family
MEFAEQILGPGVVVTGQCQQAATVVQVRDARGNEYILKHHGSETKHAREVRAYQQWAPALGQRTAQLVASSSQTMTIIITALPGDAELGASDTADVHRQAGALLRAFHGAAEPRALPGYRGWLTDRAHYWTKNAGELLSGHDLMLVRTHLDALAAYDIPQGNPCHLDFQPRNWLIDQGGIVRLVDFEHARFDIPARDLVRLYFRVWPARPDLRTAFLVGYGRDLTSTEQEMIRHLGALDALTALGRGNQNSDPSMIVRGQATIRTLRELA